MELLNRGRSTLASSLKSHRPRGTKGELLEISAVELAEMREIAEMVAG
jgi:hypothetical protein